MVFLEEACHGRQALRVKDVCHPEFSLSLCFLLAGQDGSSQLVFWLTSFLLLCLSAIKDSCLLEP